MKRHITALVALLISVVCDATPVWAATYYVTNTNDTGSGSLRQAMLDAESNAGADTIVISTTGVVAISSALPNTTQELYVDATGLSDQFVVAAYASGIYMWSVTNGAVVEVESTWSGDVPLFALTGNSFSQVRNLYVKSASFVCTGCRIEYGDNTGLGGCLYASASQVTLKESELVFCNAAYGGAIFSHDGDLSLYDTRIVECAATYNGGAIYATSSIVTADHFTLTPGQSGTDGRAAYMTGSETYWKNVTIEDLHNNTSYYLVRIVDPVEDSTFLDHVTYYADLQERLISANAPIVVRNSLFGVEGLYKDAVCSYASGTTLTDVYAEGPDCGDNDEANLGLGYDPGYEPMFTYIAYSSYNGAAAGNCAADDIGGTSRPSTNCTPGSYEP